MKIMFIIAKTGWGGPQRHVFDLALGMKQKGHDVWVALSGDGLFKKKLEGAGIYTFSIAKNDKEGNLIENSSSFRHIYSVIKNKKPDVVHFHTPKEALIGSIASRMLGISKTFNTIHGWSFNEIIPVSQKISSRLSAWLSMFLCKTTIVCSEKDYHQAIHFPGTKNRLITIDPGIKSSVFFSVDGAKQAMSKILSMNFAEFSKKTTIGAIADLNQNKGINYLIEAMVSITEQHPNTVCIIIGDGSEKTNLKNLIEKHKLQDKVFLLGYLDNAGEYLRAFQIFAVPSIKAGLSYSILEAGSASLPVVATTVGGIPEIIEDMKSGILVQSKNSKELAHALSFMIEHPDERKKYGSILRESVATKFTLQRMLDQIENAYNEPTEVR